MSKDVRKSEKISRVACTTVLAIIAVFWLIPIVWVITNSFKTNLEFQTSYTNFSTRMEYIQAMFPKKFSLQTYISLFTGEGMSTQTGIPLSLIHI